MDNSVGVGGDSISPPGSDADGRVGSLLCHLHATRYSGEVYVESGPNQVTLVFQSGNPVFAEDMSGGGSLSQEFVTREFISNRDFVDLTSHDFDAVGSCLDMGLCARAVETGKVSAAQGSELAMDWVRTHVMAVMNWDECYVDLDETIIVPASLHSWAQPLGPLIYLGVRTFYGQDAVDQMFADDSHSTIEFLAPVDAAVEFFGLEQEEAWLLEACSPSKDIPGILELSDLDPLHTWHLLTLLRLAGLVELSVFAEPSSPDVDPSGMHAVSVPSWPPGATHSSAPAATSIPAAPAVPAVAAPAATRSRPTPAPASGGYRQSSASAERVQATPSATSSRTPAAGAHPAKPRQPRAPSKRVPRAEAVARLNKELERRRPAAKSPAAGAKAAASKRAASATSARKPGRRGDKSGDYLKDLVRRRMAHQPSRGPSESLDAVAYFSRAQAELKKQAFDKALEHMSKAVAADPENEIFQAYHLWAAVRSASKPDAEKMTTLRGLLRSYVSNEDHKAFALHALGHMAFADGHDDKALKFLRKALEADAKNKDAERYLRIVERRKGSKTGEPQKIFGIELSARVGKK